MRRLLFPAILAGFVLISHFLPAVGHAKSFFTFESGQVRPLAANAAGDRLYALNTPDGRLEVFGIDDLGLTHLGSVPVGLEPVALAVRDNGDVWVVNHLSDSVSIVDSSTLQVTRTLLVGDEPRDIVFAGTVTDRAFITTAHRGQHRTHSSIAGTPGAGDPELTTEGIGRADVWVFDADNPGAQFGGAPVKIVELFGDTPRALTVSKNRKQVYAAVFHSGNQTTTVNEGLLCDGFNTQNNCLVNGITMPGGVPGPATNFAGIPAPEVGLVVKFNEANGRWEDELGRNWNNAVRFNLPDKDVFIFDANTLTVNTEFAHVGTILFNMVTNPVSGKVYVSNSDALNEVRFEGPGNFVGNSNAKPPGEPDTVQGNLHRMRVSVLDGTQVLPRHLNKHIDYTQRPAAAGISDHSLSIPTHMAVSSDGGTLYVAAFGSGRIGVLDTARLEANTLTPGQDSADYISVSGGGPSGIVLDEARNHLYVLTRFDNAVKVIDLDSKTEMGSFAMHNPEPQAVVDGRPFLYDAIISSSNGEASCASCHIFGDFDSLAWDLGDPDGSLTNNPMPIKLEGFGDTDGLNGTGQERDLNSMKGPMTTQTLRGMLNSGSMHWRGDRTGGNDAGGSAFDSDAAFKKFSVAFPGLLGKDGNISAADMAAFTQFILEVVLPPNPVRALDNSLTVNQQAGRDLFFGPRRTDGLPNDVGGGGAQLGFTCDGCHTLDAADGFFGTNGEASHEGEPQILKIPHLRNMYQKVGMFGMAAAPFFNAGDNIQKGDQVRGFGFFHDGSVDTLLRFFNAEAFNNNNGVGFIQASERNDMEDFTLAFDTDLAPIVGQQITLQGNGDADTNARIDLLINRSDAAFDSEILGANARECDLVVKGTISGDTRGWRHTGGGSFTGDDDAVLSDAQLRAMAIPQGNSLTYTCQTFGSGLRAGTDRDLDQLPDGLDNCVAAANASQADLDNDGIGNACDLQHGDNMQQLLPLSDINGNGASDFAVLLRLSGGYSVSVKDGATGERISFPDYGVGAVFGGAALADVSGNGADEVAVLAVLEDDSVSASVFDSLTGALLRKISFAPSFSPVAFDVIPDAGGPGAPALVVLGVNAQGDVRAQSKSASNGSLVSFVQFAPSFSPKFLKILPDVTGNNISELAVLGIDAGGNIRVQLKDSVTGQLKHWIQYARAFDPIELLVFPDAGLTGGAAIGVLGEHSSDGRIRLQLKDADTRTLIGNFSFSNTFAPITATVIDDLNGNNVSDVAYLGINAQGKIRAQVKDGLTRTQISKVFFSQTFAPSEIAAFSNVDGNNTSELAVLGVNTNGQPRVQIKDGATAAQLNNVFVP